MSHPPRFATLDDKAEVTGICMHPEVRKWTACDGAPDFDADRWFKGRNMIVLMQGGCFLSNWLGDRTWQVHTNILPEARGKWALVNAGLSIMLGFIGSEAESFVTMVPANNRPAKWFALNMGFRSTFTRKDKWPHGGKLWDLNFYRLDIDDWILQGHLLEVGKAFHKEVELQLGHESHAEDSVHDCYVGACIALVNAGRVDKAMRIYNRWAREAGYVPLQVVAHNPLVIDAQTFFISVVDGKMVLKSKELANA